MHPHPTAAHNPFATRWTRPGAIPYRFPPGDSLQQTVSRLSAHGWKGQIIGQHGSGKSSLVANLVPALLSAGRTARGFDAGDGRRPPGCRRPPAHDWTPRTVVIVDGYDRLSRWSRMRLFRGVKRCGCGLLVTTHAPCRLPVLAHLQPDLDTVLHLVDYLLADDAWPIRREDVIASFHRQRANVREVLFDLYEVYERNVRAP